MSARDKPRQTKQEVRQRLAELFGEVMDLCDAQPKTEQERLDIVRGFARIGLDALGRVDEKSLKEIRFRRRLSAAILGPLKQEDDEKWLRRQLEGLGKEPER